MRKGVNGASFAGMSALRLALIALLGFPLAGRAATVVQPGFSDTVYASGLAQPTALEWAPDGSRRLFVSLQASGIVALGPGGATRKTFASFKPIFFANECGSLSVCFDPNYLHNRFVYAFVTVSATEQRIYRMQDLGGVASGVTPIVRKLPSRGINHNGGALAFGRDARLYWAVGDNGIKRGVDGDLTMLAAKVGRAFHDGSAPPDNPFFDGAGPRNDYIWASGFRNPFTMAFQPRTGLLWLNVVGSTPEGQTEPHSTAGFEQIFALSGGGEDGGYDDYEGNQPGGARFNSPFARPLAKPVLQYKTDYAGEAGSVRTLAALSRSSGVLTVLTQVAHPYRVGQIVVLTGTDSFDGSYLVKEVTGERSFTAADPGQPDAIAANATGSVRPPLDDGCVTGGAFYESTAFPAELRGGYFFGDLKSQTLWQLELDAQGKPIRPRRLVTGAAITDVALGPDGALYYTSHSDNSVHRLAYTQPTSLVVTPSTLQMVEGGLARFHVRLPSAPATTVDVQVTSGSPAVTVATGATLTFTSANWQIPQTVTLTAAVDSDRANGSADLTVAAAGYSSEAVKVNVIDTTANAPVVSTLSLSVPRGGTRTLQVLLPDPPPKSVSLVARRVSGSSAARVTSGGTLVFTPENWHTPQEVTVSMAANAPSRPTTIEVWGRGYFRRTISVTPE